jgi:hypothetical protein
VNALVGNIRVIGLENAISGGPPSVVDNVHSITETALNLDYFTPDSLSSLGYAQFGQSATPSSYGLSNSAALGSRQRPWDGLYLGNVATDNYLISPQAGTGGERTLNLRDQTASGAFAFGDQSDPTKEFLFDSHTDSTGTVATFQPYYITADRTYNFPDASITVPGNVTWTCGTSQTGSAANCSGNSTNISTSTKEVIGTAALVSGTPSTVTVTNMPAFTSATSYGCSATSITATVTIAAGNLSATSVEFTGPNSSTAVFFYDCKGN